MDLKQAFLLRYTALREFHIPFFYKEIPEDKLRSRPVKEVNPIAWCLWHITRTEDIGLNRMVTNSSQVFDDGSWMDRLKLPYRHFGIGMTAAEVAGVAATIDIHLLEEYSTQVGERSVEIVNRLDPVSLDAIVTDDYILQVLKEEGAVKPEKVMDSLAAYRGNPKGWFLMHMCMTHTYIHIGEMNTIASLMGIYRI
jgi:hypothetical protein